ncbi:MAG: hypothetical protein L6R38_001986 [Xanthoria sp. 2 TBL-2021]|nr:MAG: hypothetical protein L6R38_001986 [Xanthoria sp. 2 TBL-2021]
MATLAAGYTILNSTITPDLIQAAADQISSGAVRNLAQFTKHREFTNTIDKLVLASDSRYQTFDLGPIRLLLEDSPDQKVPQPVCIRFGQFHSTPIQDRLEIFSCEGGQVHVTITITRLIPTSGWFLFYEGSHLMEDPTDKVSCVPVPTVLKPGQAMAWHGELAYTSMSGGGGSFITMVFG